MQKKTATFGGRLDPTLRNRLDAIHAKNYTNDSVIFSTLIAAFCEAVEAKKGILTSPIRVMVGDDIALMAAEEQSSYGSGYQGAGSPLAGRSPSGAEIAKDVAGHLSRRSKRAETKVSAKA